MTTIQSFAIEHCGSNKVYSPTGETMWCDLEPGHADRRHWSGNVSWVDDAAAATAEAKAFIHGSLDKLKASDLGEIGPQQRHFLFLMRSRLADHEQRGRPFFCSEKQLEYMRDLVALNEERRKAKK